MQAFVKAELMHKGQNQDNFREIDLVLIEPHTKSICLWNVMLYKHEIPFIV